MLKVTDGRVPVLSLSEYFTDHDRLKIPNWQRDYSWDASDEGQVGVLLEDLQAFVANQSATEYLMGSVILCDSDNSGEHLVIDGQQRSLTLTIFLMAALKYIRNNNLVNPHDAAHMALHTAISQCFSSGAVGFAFQSRVIMNNPQADKVIKRIYDWSQVGDEQNAAMLDLAGNITKSERNLVEVAQYIYRRLVDESVFDKGSFMTAMRKITEGVKFVVLTLDNQSEALRVYDRINNRGMVLSSADLIKNIIFMMVDDSDFEYVSDCWLEMSKELNGTAKARLQDPKFLLRLLASIDLGTKITYDGLVDHWTDYIGESSKKALELANDLPVRAIALRNLAQHQSMLPGVEIEDWMELTPVQITQLHIPYELNSVQHYAVLLAGMHFEKPETIQKLGQQVATRALLYIFAQERTQSFETIIPVWANAVKNLPKDADPVDLDSVYAQKAFMADNPIELLEAALKANIRAWSYENASDRKRIRAMFALLNLELSMHFDAPNLMRTKRKVGETHGWEIDHIMPKSLVTDPWVHRIGNLTLLAPVDNRWAGAIKPIEKINDNYYSQSEVALTKICDDLGKQAPAGRAKIQEGLDEAGLAITYTIDTNWDASGVDTRTEFFVDWATYVLVEKLK